jgi:hypothetical protein
MGLIPSELVGDNTAIIADIFAMPQNDTGLSVKVIGNVVQTKMLGILEKTGRCIYKIIHEKDINININIYIYISIYLD